MTPTPKEQAAASLIANLAAYIRASDGTDDARHLLQHADAYLATPPAPAVSAEPAPAGLTDAGVRAVVVATREYMLGFLSPHLPGGEVYEHLRCPRVEAAMCAAIMDCESVRAALSQREGSAK